MFRELMTLEELKALESTQALALFVACLNGWYVKGSRAVFKSTAGQEAFPLCSYVCVLTGKENSLWQFEKELY